VNKGSNEGLQRRSVPRLSAKALRLLIGASRLALVRRAAAKIVRDHLGISAAVALDAGLRSPMPLYYETLKARPNRSYDSSLGLPASPTAVASAGNWSDAFASGATDPVAAVRQVIAEADRLKSATPSMNCFSYIDEEGAMRDAVASRERWRSGQPLGPLDGVVVPIKEMASIQGSAFRLGTSFLPDRDDRDATAVARLRAAGAIILGQTPMTEMGMSAMGVNVHRNMPCNAHAANRGAGGSSTGSAVAVASGLAPVTLACDGGGSIRMPASFNGIFGIKPTAGRVSRDRDGFGGTLDHFGPIGASAHDLAVFLEACAGPDELDPITSAGPKVQPGEFVTALGRGVRGLRIGVLQAEIDAADSAVAKACREALTALEAEGAQLVDVSWDLAPFASGIGFIIISLETYAELLEQRRDPGVSLNPDFEFFLQALSAFEANDYIDALCLRRTLQEQCAELLRHVDVLALPTTVGVAPKISHREMAEGFSDLHELRRACRFTLQGNLTGLPCGQAPVGTGEAGLPVGLQIVGDAFDEASVLAVMAHLERMGVASLRKARIAANPLGA